MFTPHGRRGRLKRFAIAGLATVAAVAAAAPLLDNPVEARGAGHVPRFTIKATQFVGYDETGTDWLGADEIYIGSDDRNRIGRSSIAITKLWQGVDTGDSRQIPATQQCLSRTHLSVDAAGDGAPEGYEGDEWQCVGSTSIDVEVDVWEKEGDYNPFEFDPDWLGVTWRDHQDEHVGGAHIEYSAAELKLILDERDESFAWTQHFDQSGHYGVTLVVTRIT